MQMEGIRLEWAQSKEYKTHCFKKNNNNNYWHVSTLKHDHNLSLLSFHLFQSILNVLPCIGQKNAFIMPAALYSHDPSNIGFHE